MKAVVLSLLVASSAFASDPFSTAVVSYVPGSNPSAGYTNPAAAIGEPTRFTGVGVFPSAVTPFNPAFLSSEVVSIGAGGSLTMQFDHPVTNDVQNPFGIDMIIFGNTFYNDLSYPLGIMGGVVSAGRGLVEVSLDGVSWLAVPGAAADSESPTLGYSDLTDPYALVPGTVLSDFTRPVNPAFDASGRSFAEIVAAYNGSGGGTGIDLAAAGVSAIQFVRITNPTGSTVSVEIDAISDVSAVPAPSGLVVMTVVGAGAVRRRRESGRKAHA